MNGTPAASGQELCAIDRVKLIVTKSNASNKSNKSQKKRKSRKPEELR